MNNRPTFILVLLGLLMASCNQSIDQPSDPPILASKVVELRSGQLPQGAELLFTVWGETAADSLHITTAQQSNGGWAVKKPFEFKKNSQVSALFPSHLQRHEEAILVMEREQSPVYFFSKKLGESDSRKLDIDFRQVQSTVSMHFDVSQFSPNDRIDEVRVQSRYTYGWIHLNNGNFTRMDIPFDESTVYTHSVGKTIAEVSDQGKYTFDYLLLPQGETSMMVWIKINGRDYVTSLLMNEARSNHQYHFEISLLNRYSITPLTDEEKKRGQVDGNEVIEDIFFSDYEYTTTSEYLKSISNNHGVVFTYWLDSRIEEVPELEYKVLIRDEVGNVVARSPIYGGLKIQPYHYDGFSVPIYIDAPKEGKYTQQLLLRKKGDTQWYEPNQKGDDTPQDKEFEVHREQSVFASAFRLDKGGEKASVAGITQRKYNHPYTAQLTLNNYSSSPKTVKIRLYNRRAPKEMHSNITLSDESAWQDLVGHTSVVLSPLSSNEVLIDYQITVKHSSVDRFSPYICATITYPDQPEKEYPLLMDGSLIFRVASSVYHPAPIVTNSYVNNKAYISIF
ncbi:hypothetical protein [Porphyromonas levii]|uniref:hypothetical protein n=1 Tax=Porphyromonas levii TaxID=28114 RepID=UPI0003A0F23F|nr:hypothetical protein [Porphyromonas levii]